MIHDLTANNDFHNDSFGFLGRWRDIFDRANRDDELTPPDNEIVLTGSGFDREHKRYILDYESDTKNMCDCCGAPIKIRPWDFEENKTLCPDCEKFLEEQMQPKEDGTLLEEIVDDSFKVRVRKPWDMDESERESAINNVLLWD